MRETIVFVMVVTLGLAVGCAHDRPLTPIDLPPVACFSIRVEHERAGCPQWPTLVFDASCSSDDNTTADSLKVRWDFENDGTWDTPYLPARRQMREPQPFSGPQFWTARCEVRDQSGRLGQSSTSCDLGPRPEFPDLAAYRVSFEVAGDGAPVESVHVGQEFAVFVWVNWCGDIGDRTVVVRYLRDGVTIYDQHGAPGTAAYFEWGKDGMIVDRPGDYAFMVVVDADNDVQESSEVNNAATAILRVLP